MNYTLSKIFIFAAGALVGSAVTWKLLNAKYEQMVEADVASVKEYYARRENFNPIDDDTEHREESHTEPDREMSIREYAAKLAESGYTDYSNGSNNKEKEVTDLTRPKIISPDEFGDCDYETISLTYYADGVLADDADEPITDIDEVVGNDAFNHFGDYEPDSVFVRNDDMRTDYEILRDNRTYREVTGVEPHRADEE